MLQRVRQGSRVEREIEKLALIDALQLPLES